jgi:hypothetical protein
MAKEPKNNPYSSAEEKGYLIGENDIPGSRAVSVAVMLSVTLTP